MKQNKIKEILEDHKKWLEDNLSGIRADLRSADLRSADLGDANLRSANLRSANLGDANLMGADLGGADLRGANLGGANLMGANLRDADLGDANLRSANLRGADLGDANLGGANLMGADLRGTKGYLRIAYPSEGSFTCYKKCRDLKSNMYIITLFVPEHAKRVGTVNSRKFRVSEAVVKKIEIYGAEKFVEIKENTEGLTGYMQGGILYVLGETVYPDKFDDNDQVECSHGIHAYITKLEAVWAQ